MGITEAEGIITREVKYGDSSRILTVLTAEYGKISVLAGGVRTNRSGLLSATQMFSHVSLQLFRGKEKGLFKINSGELLTSFGTLRNSLDKMAYASYFCEIANTVIQENAPDEPQVRLLLNTLYLLENDKLSFLQIKSVFEFRTLALQGLLPDFSRCIVCDDASPSHFSLHRGGALCSSCAKKLKDSLPDLVHTGGAALKTISYINYIEDKKAFSFSLSDTNLAYLSDLGEYCIEYFLERHFKTLDYLKKVQKLG